MPSTPSIYYDPADPFGGTQFNRSLGLEGQPSAKIAHSLNYDWGKFNRAAGPPLMERWRVAETVYAVHVVNLRNTYQFNSKFFLRAIAQYDSSKRRVLGDFLASYELVPGTVAHLGYGSVLESIDRRPYLPTTRALFFKVSYT